MTAFVKENMQKLEMQCKGTDDTVKSMKDQFTTMQENKDEDLRLLNLSEKQNEDVRK